MGSLVDPTGVTSALSAGISAKNGEWLDAGLSTLGAIPLLGKFADAAKVEKDITVIEKLASDGEKVVADGEKVASKVGEIPKSPTGKGSVSPGERDPKRLFSKSEKAEMLEKQGGKCAQCGEAKTVDEVHGHHVERHADGGKTNSSNGAAVCKTCHTEIHQ